MTIEDNGANEELATPEVTPEVIPEELATPEVIPEEPEFQDFTDTEFEDLLNALGEGISSLEEPEITTEPVFGEEEVSDEEVEQLLDSAFKELEDKISLIESEKDTILQEKEAIIQEKETIETEFQELKETFKISEELFDKLREYPVIGEYVMKIMNGEEVNIPEIIRKNLSEGLNNTPKTEKTETVMVSIPETKKPEPKISTWGNMGGNKLFD